MHQKRETKSENSSTKTDVRSRERRSDPPQPDRDPSTSAHPLHQRQRAQGNQAMQRLVQAGIRPKLRVAAPNDVYEREADRVADAVVSGSDSAPVDVTGGEHAIQRAPASGGTTIDAGLERQVRAIRGGGRPLPPGTRSFFESRFGHDFGDVRLHTGPQTDAVARAIDARAFTVGTDVVVDSQEYSTGDREGKRLLAHELSHVVQQRAAYRTDGTAPVEAQPDNESVLRRQTRGSYARTAGGFVEFDPGKPGGETFIAQSAAQARKNAMDAGAIEREAKTAKSVSGVIELEETTIVADMVAINPVEGQQFKYVSRDEAEKIRNQWEEVLFQRMREVHWARERHANYIRQKMGLDIGAEPLSWGNALDADAWGKRFDRGFKQMSHEAAEFAGGLTSGSFRFEPPPLSIWQDPLADLRNAVLALEGDVVDLDLAQFYYEFAWSAVQRAKERFYEFETNTLETGASAVLTGLEWTRDLSFAVATGIAVTLSGGASLGVQTLVAGGAGGGFTALKQGSTQFGERLAGLRNAYDVGAITEEALEGAVINALGQALIGPLASKFVSRINAELSAKYGVQVGSEFLEKFVGSPISRDVFKGIAHEIVDAEDMSAEEIVEEIVVRCLTQEGPKRLLLTVIENVAK